jgi:hypothetical protein
VGLTVLEQLSIPGQSVQAGFHPGDGLVIQLDDIIFFLTANLENLLGQTVDKGLIFHMVQDISETDKPAGRDQDDDNQNSAEADKKLGSQVFGFY